MAKITLPEKFYEDEMKELWEMAGYRVTVLHRYTGNIGTWVTVEVESPIYELMKEVTITALHPNRQQDLFDELDKKVEETYPPEDKGLYCRCAEPSLKKEVAGGEIYDFCKVCKKEYIR